MDAAPARPRRHPALPQGFLIYRYDHAPHRQLQGPFGEEAKVEPISRVLS
jgi:hypothetical protein